MKSSAHIVLITGGTGGHVFPAVAVSQELQKRGFTISIISDQRGMIWKTHFQQVANFYIIRASNSLWKAPFMLFWGFLTSMCIFIRSRPKQIISFGGYFSVAPLCAAFCLNIPFILHEGNIILGKANRLFAKKAMFVAVSFQKTKYIPKKTRIVYTGMPLRILPNTSQPKRFILLVIGGSLSARIFSEIMPNAVRNLNLELWLQTYASPLDIKGIFSPFFNDLLQRIACASLIISRSGASTLWEIISMAKPCLFIPLPKASDNHQYENAKFIVDQGAAYMIEEKDLTEKKLRHFIIDKMRNPKSLEELSLKAKHMNIPDGTKTLCDQMIAEL